MWSFDVTNMDLVGLEKKKTRKLILLQCEYMFIRRSNGRENERTCARMEIPFHYSRRDLLDVVDLYLISLALQSIIVSMYYTRTILAS